jgi:hypothetical protein
MVIAARRPCQGFVRVRAVNGYRGVAFTVIGLSSLMIHGAAMAAESHCTDEQLQLIVVDKRMQRAFVNKDIAILESILTDDPRLSMTARGLTVAATPDTP